MSTRLHYVDWLRILAVLLLFPFHTSRVFNAFEDFYIKSPYISQALNLFIGFVDRWHMPLLFFLAGASTYYALRKRKAGQYLIERVKRLLVPFFFGVLLWNAPQTWVGAHFNSGSTQGFGDYLISGAYLVPNIQDGGDYYGGLGIAHLWFVLFLFVISVVVLPLLLWARGNRGSRVFAKLGGLSTRPLGWLVPTFMILVAEGLPELAGKSFFTYTAFFVLGFAVFSDEEAPAFAEKYRWPALIIGAAGTIFWMFTGDLRDTLPDPSLQIIAVVLPGFLAAWCGVMAAVGFGRRYLDKPSKTLAYLAPASYPLYVIHQTMIVFLAYFIVRMPGGWPVQWLLLFVGSVAGSFGLYEVVRRIPGVRFLFGLKA